MSTSESLKQIFAAARPLVEQRLDNTEQMAALRDAATNAGLDWSQVKALVTAQVQDERDEAGDGKHIKRVLEKAEFASAYADMLGLGNMNENNISTENGGAPEMEMPPPADEVGALMASSAPIEPLAGLPQSDLAPVQGEEASTVPVSSPDLSHDAGEIPDFLDRRKARAA